jgi:hypothetical protein
LYLPVTGLLAGIASEPPLHEPPNAFHRDFLETFAWREATRVLRTA